MPAPADIVTGVWQRIKESSRRPDYERLPLSEKEPVSPVKRRRERHSLLRYLGVVFAVFLSLSGIYGLIR